MRIKQAQEYDNSFANLEFAQMIKEFGLLWIVIHLPYMTDSVEEHRICVCVTKCPLEKMRIGQERNCEP